MADIITVSIVDDDEDTRELIAQKLAEEDGFECLHVYGDSEVAIKGILKNPTDLVLMDINMPKVNGIECVRRLHTWMQETDFVMLTAYDTSDLIFEALEAGATGYLLKRNVAASLIQELKKVTAGGSPMDNAIARMVVESFHKRSTEKGKLIAELSERQHEILKLIARGKSNKMISAELDISIYTVNGYVRRIYEKLQVNSRTEAVAKYNNLDVD